MASADAGGRVSTDTSKKVPLQQRRGSKVTVRTLLPTWRRCARSLSEIIARMGSLSLLIKPALPGPDAADEAAAETEGHGYNKADN